VRLYRYGYAGENEAPQKSSYNLFHPVILHHLPAASFGGLDSSIELDETLSV
jgi:hypothetical protein